MHILPFLKYGLHLVSLSAIYGSVVLLYIVILSTLENKAVSAARCLGPVGPAALS
jgi:hypothetical protein